MYLVVYDITDARRLRFVAKVYESYGMRVQKSVFECELEKRDFDIMWRKLTQIIDQNFDSLICYKRRNYIALFCR